jgi:hypothetical protein
MLRNQFMLRDVDFHFACEQGTNDFQEQGNQICVFYAKSVMLT